MTPRPRQTITCYFDTRSNPVSFDFVNFLAVCAFIKRKNDCEVNLCIVAPAFRRTNSIEVNYEESYLWRRVTNIFSPIADMSALFGCVSIQKSIDFEVAPRCFPPDYHPARAPHGTVSPVALLPLSYRALEALWREEQFNPAIFRSPSFEAGVVARRYQRENLVTITLRNTPHNSARNGPLDVLYALYVKLRADGYSVIVIPDQDDVLGSGEFRAFDWSVDLLASVDHRYRLAMYYSARQNFGWTSGVLATLLLSDAPYVTFGVFNSRSGVSARQFFDRKGPTFGLQLPWANSRQYIDWTEASQVTKEYVFAVAEKLLP
jgi:hypothetical protein